MRVYFHELSEDPKSLQFNEKDSWVHQTVQAAQETDVSKSQHCLVKFVLKKSHAIIFLKGSAQVSIGLICSRCAASFDFPVHTSFETLYTHQSIYNSNHSHSDSHGSSYGIAYSEQVFSSEGKKVELEYVEKDYIELADVLKEQIYLQIPYQPLCKEDCKGICPTCGQDQNLEPCQCYRIQKAFGIGIKK